MVGKGQAQEPGRRNLTGNHEDMKYMKEAFWIGQIVEKRWRDGLQE